MVCAYPEQAKAAKEFVEAYGHANLGRVVSDEAAELCMHELATEKDLDWRGTVLTCSAMQILWRSEKISTSITSLSLNLVST